MEETAGLAHTMVYGTGESNTIKHYYAGSKDKKKKERKKGK